MQYLDSIDALKRGMLNLKQADPLRSQRGSACFLRGYLTAPLAQEGL